MIGPSGSRDTVVKEGAPPFWRLWTFEGPRQKANTTAKPKKRIDRGGGALISDTLLKEKQIVVMRRDKESERQCRLLKIGCIFISVLSAAKRSQKSGGQQHTKAMAGNDTRLHHPRARVAKSTQTQHRTS